MKNRSEYSLVVGSVITAFLLGVMIMGCFFTPYDPTAMDSGRKFADFSMSHLMGCDQFGRDIFSRILVGGRSTLFIAVATTAIGTIGILIGGLSGYIGGFFDQCLMRINDTLFSFPSILLALVCVGILGKGVWQMILALGISFIPSFTRVARSEFLKQKNMDYVKNAKLLGAGTIRIVLFHILPNSKTVLITCVMIGFNNAVLAEAGLSFLGLGVAPPNASLGGMLSEAQAFLFSKPSYAISLGVILILFVWGVSLLADGLERRGQC